MHITVFTPTYNRAYIIKKLYESLQRQTFRDFEWIVADDGSTDNTAELLAQIRSENNDFPVRYIKTENGGKHRAINLGVQMASGDLFFIVDSDDYLTDDALERIVQVESSIPTSDKVKFAGVCGLRGYTADKIIGNTFDGEILDITTLERTQYGISGDKAEVFYTHVLKAYPFPEFEGEKFVTECVVWDKIAADGYVLRFYNQIAIICNYLEDGLTSQGEELLWRNPKGYGLYLYQCGLFGKITGVEKWNTYLRYYYHYRQSCSFREIARNLCMNLLAFRLRILGMQIFYKLYDR